MFNFIKRHKIACGLVLVDIIVVLVAILVVVYDDAKSAMIDIYVAPVDAKIELNDKVYGNFASYNLLPGEYHVKISMDGMQTKEFDLSLDSGGYERIKTYLLDDKGGFDYYAQNYDDELILTDVAEDAKAQEFIKKYEQVHRIVNVLPIVYSAYSDDYSEYTHYEIRQSKDDCTRIVCLEIVDYTGGNEAVAKRKLVDEGYNLENYGISYVYSPSGSVRTNDE